MATISKLNTKKQEKEAGTNIVLLFRSRNTID